jgi:hypothetical protein
VTGSPKQEWAQLFRVACALIQQVNSEQEIIDYWTFGGGTAMMLQIDHRESRDVDFFLRDPQFLPSLMLKSGTSSSRLVLLIILVTAWNSKNRI